MSKSEWLKTVEHWKNKWPLYIEDYEDDSDGINLYTFVEILNKFMTSNDIVVSDAGSAIYVPSQNLKMKHNQKFVLSGAQADMGFSVPASIGVSLSSPDKNVLVFTGDGSFNSNIQELATIRNLNLPVKIFVWNNGGYLSIRNTQNKFYNGRVYGTSTENGLWFPEIKKIADAYEFSYFLAEKNIDLENQIEEILQNSKPTLIEIKCKQDQEIVPTLMLKKNPVTNRNIQCGLNDMYPFLSDEELCEEMIVNK